MVKRLQTFWAFWRIVWDHTTMTPKTNELNSTVKLGEGTVDVPVVFVSSIHTSSESASQISRGVDCTSTLPSGTALLKSDSQSF